MTERVSDEAARLLADGNVTTPPANRVAWVDVAADLLDARRERDEARRQLAALRKALAEIAKGSGPYSMDPFEHATNTIKAIKEAAQAALAADAAGKGGA